MGLKITVISFFTVFFFCEKQSKEIQWPHWKEEQSKGPVTPKFILLLPGC